MKDGAVVHYIEWDTVSDVVLVTDFIDGWTDISDDETILLIESVRKAAQTSMYIGIQMKNGRVYLLESMNREYSPGEIVESILRQ